MQFQDLKKELLKNPKFKVVRDETDLAIRVGAEINSFRINHDLTQKQLAELIGTQQSNIARIESGKFLPRLSTLHKMAEAVGTFVIEPTFASLAERRVIAQNVNQFDRAQAVATYELSQTFITSYIEQQAAPNPVRKTFDFGIVSVSTFNNEENNTINWDGNIQVPANI